VVYEVFGDVFPKRIFTNTDLQNHQSLPITTILKRIQTKF
jgi:hypothetical protein